MITLKMILRLITGFGFFLLIGTAGAGDMNTIDKAIENKILAEKLAEEQAKLEAIRAEEKLHTYLLFPITTLSMIYLIHIVFCVYFLPYCF